MSKYIIDSETLTDIADAIRAKTGDSDTLTPLEMPDAIESIPSGGGGSDDYFYVEGIEAGTIKFSAIGTVDVALQYSTDKTNWTNYTLETNINIAIGQKIYWKNNKDYLSKDNNNYVKLNSGSRVNLGGRINSLINNIDGKGCYPYAFSHLFSSLRVVDASNLVLNKHVADSCYSSMFQSCTSLTTAPQLPATTLASSCYFYMFYGCASLTTAPQLPATTLASNCYYCMFYGCTSLTIAPQLPATTLANSCYSEMFQGCTSLTTAPQLPATTLASQCYFYMFYGCSSLKVYSSSGEGHDKAWSIPTDGAIQGSTYAQTNMFSGVETDNVPANFPGTSGQQFIYYTQNEPV